MNLRIRRSQAVELSLNEASILLQAVQYAIQHFSDWKNASPEWDWPNEVTRLGITKEEVEQCGANFIKVYEAMKAEIQHGENFKASRGDIME